MSASEKQHIPSSGSSEQDIQPPQQRRHVFHQDVRPAHYEVFKKSLFMMLFLGVGVMGAFSVFWGAMFRRSDRVHNLRVGVIDWDQGVVGDLFMDQVRARPQEKTLVSLDYIPPDMFTTKEQIETLVVQFNYWGVLVIEHNATEDTKAVLDGDLEDAHQISYYYASARQETIHWSYVHPQISDFQAQFLEKQVPHIQQSLTADFSDSQVANIIRNNITTLKFANHDIRPFTGGVASAIDNVGLIYLIIVSFQQTMLWNLIHAIIVPYKVVFWQRFLYRCAVNCVSMFVVSLCFSLVSLAYQQDFELAYGKAGFVVYWLINYLAMLALGGATDNIQIIFVRHFPPLLPVWLLFWVIVNTATAMFPLEVSPGVYQYGKAMPLYNAIEAIRTILFNVKSSIGLNVGVLLAWIVVNWCIAFVGLWNNDRLDKKKQQK
ncbi:Nitrosoguanidine resistance protein [Yarrowia sp. B02]|nr:Nitrosoguanidine resistance protein [Yarrowia sp. B02]